MHMRFLLPLVLATSLLSAQSAPDFTALQKAAEQGDANAQLQLARAYQDGNGVTANDDIAAQWLKRAADAGNADAQNSLGVAYRMGRGVSRDLKEAVRWYRKAAQNGSANAMFNMGTVYFNGDGESYNDEKALAWFLVAADAGSTEAKSAVEDIQKRMNAISQHDVRLSVAAMYENGEGVMPDPIRAFAMYLKEARDPVTQLKVSSLYSLGFGVTRDEAEAIRWCEKSARGGNEDAMLQLGARYQYGQDVPRDLEAAKYWYLKAAESGSGRGALSFGRMSIDQDAVTALKWLLIADAEKTVGAAETVAQAMQHITPAQKEEARKKASSWWKAHRIGALVFPR